MYKCRSITFLLNEKDKGKAQTKPLYCKNIGRCEMCRKHRADELASSIAKYCEGDDQPWFMGYVKPEKADDVSQSITRAHGLYLRVTQPDRVVFLTNEPRRIRDAQPIEITRESLELIIDDLLRTKPKNGKTANNLPKKMKPENEAEGHLIKANHKTVNIRMESAGAEYTGTKNHSAFWKADNGIVESVLESFGESDSQIPENVPDQDEDTQVFLYDDLQEELPGLK